MVDIDYAEKRFLISKNTLSGYKEIRTHLEERAKTDTHLIGAIFIGGRIQGFEHEKSDFDTVVFYDGTEFEFPPNRSPVDILPVTNKLIQQRKDYIIGLQKDVVGMMQEHGYPVQMPLSATVFPVDTSPAADLRNFTNLKYEIQRKVGSNPIEHTKLDVDPMSPAFSLSARFLLGVGQRLPEIRARALSLFEQDPNGEKLFGDLMQFLAYFERTQLIKKHSNLPPYSAYPTTIAEARKVFLGSS